MIDGGINPAQNAGIPFPMGVLWDMDGVICDNGDLHFQSWQETFANFPEYNFSKEIFIQTFGMNNHGVLHVLLGREPEEAEVEDIAGKKEAIFREILVGKTTFLPGVEEWLVGFRAHGIQQAIASSAPQANINALRRELHLDQYFDAFISAASMPSKPDPMVFITAARELGVEPSNCVVIEDAVAGVKAGISAGCKVIAVTTTNLPEALTEAHLVVDSLNQVDFSSWADCSLED